MAFSAAAIASFLTLSAQPAAAQAVARKSPQDIKWSLPRTPDGHPDFQGVWANNSATPLERPKEFEGKEFLTEQEAAAFEQQAARNVDQRGEESVGTAADVGAALHLTRPWQHLGVRIIGSWIAASAILVLALTFTR